MSGKHCKHTLKRLAAGAGVDTTAAALSEFTSYCTATPKEPIGADVTDLAKALRAYWREQNLAGGQYPAKARLVLGSRIKLWAKDTHYDIGYAYGHPNVDGRRRWRARHARPEHFYRLESYHAVLGRI